MVPGERAAFPASPAMSARLLVIVPAYNESANVAEVVRDIMRSAPQWDILVIDDASRDGTAQEAAGAGAQVIRLPFNMGIGAVMQTGFRFARDHGYDVCVQVDADGQHRAEYLPVLHVRMQHDRADMVIASRFILHRGYASSFFRRVGISFFSWLLLRLTGVRVTDPTSGFRMYSRRAFSLCAESYAEDYPEPEALVRALRSGLKLVEVPVEMHPRTQGSSSITPLKAVYYMLKVTLAMLCVPGTGR